MSGDLLQSWPALTPIQRQKWVPRALVRDLQHPRSLALSDELVVEHISKAKCCPFPTELLCLQVSFCCILDWEHKCCTLKEEQELRWNCKLHLPITLTVPAGKWLGEVRCDCFAGDWSYKQVAEHSKFGQRWKHFKQTEVSYILLTVKYFFRDADVSFSEVRVSFGEKTLEGICVYLTAVASQGALGSWSPFALAPKLKVICAETLP